VGATDAFMNAVTSDGHYELIHPRTGRPTGKLRAAQVFDAIIQAAWQTGDPGLLFLDTINRANPTPHLGAIEASNPCGEVPLLPYEACNLGSIHLAHMLREQSGRPEIDEERLRAFVRVAVRFLDDVIEVNKLPIPEIERMVRGNRKIGLGVMGFAELLIRLGIPYDSDEAVQVAERVMSLIADEARKASQELAEERGVFPYWRGSVYEAQNMRVRNATRTAVAPTGTISIIAGTSASIEPLFALAYKRTGVLGGQTLYEINPLFVEYVEGHGLEAEKFIEQVLEEGSLKGVEGVPEELKRLFVTALEIPPERHLAIQAAFQRHVDNSVSKTINLPREATVEDVKRAYLWAWELGLKGITIYRYGSKSAQVLELGVDEEAHQYDHASKCDPEECRI
jgi:ribonucleoside-diphosphate reductase alpha chain